MDENDFEVTPDMQEALDMSDEDVAAELDTSGEVFDFGAPLKLGSIEDAYTGDPLPEAKPLFDVMEFTEEYRNQMKDWGYEFNPGTGTWE